MYGLAILDAVKTLNGNVVTLMSSVVRFANVTALDFTQVKGMLIEMTELSRSKWDQHMTRVQTLADGYRAATDLNTVYRDEIEKLRKADQDRINRAVSDALAADRAASLEAIAAADAVIDSALNSNIPTAGGSGPAGEFLPTDTVPVESDASEPGEPDTAEPVETGSGDPVTPVDPADTAASDWPGAESVGTDDTTVSSSEADSRLNG